MSPDFQEYNEQAMAELEQEMLCNIRAEYSWSDLLDKVADVRRERDQFFEELEVAKFSERELRDELLEALGGKRARVEAIGG